MKSTIAKKTEGYGYKYTELADINNFCEENGIRYWQETETCEINGKDYIITYVEKGNDKVEKHRGCQIVDAVLKGIKNPVQEYGSSLTYCRRYSLLMALGLATTDDDGASCKVDFITTDDITTFNDMIIKYDKDPEEVFKYFKIKDSREMTKKQFEEFKKICEKSSK